MKQVYLDNAATSFPKAPGVVENMAYFLTEAGCNINRGVYDLSHKVENTVYETREMLGRLFNHPTPEQVIFTRNVTESLNVLIKGLLKTGDHIIISSLEHNAVMRPLNSLVAKGITYSKAGCDQQGNLDLHQLSSCLKPNTKAVLMTHASNVSGAILPLKAVGEFCRNHNLFFLIDSAQTAGFLDIDMTQLGIDALAFTGHKSLLGPQGIGGFILTDRLSALLPPLITGGTGSFSDSEEQPSHLPDKYESGTLNLPGIYGLNAALHYLHKKGLEPIRQQELALTLAFLEIVLNIPGVKVIGQANCEQRTALVSLDLTPHDNAEISFTLAKEYGIMTRCGLHCAPSAHQALGTYPQGTIRFSFSHFNTLEEVKYAGEALAKCLKM